MADCPQCGHHVDLPSIFFSRVWKNLKCFFCGAELKRKGRRWYVEFLLVGAATAVFVDTPGEAKKFRMLAYLVPAIVGIIDSLSPRLELKYPGAKPAMFSKSGVRAESSLRPARRVLDIFNRGSID